MSLGIAALQTSQKKEPVPQPGPPFAANSAFNGDSVDTVTGKIVVGNDVGDPLSPAQLLSDREIATNSAFAIELVDFFIRSLRLRLTEQRILLEEIATGSNFTVTAFGGTPNLQLTGSSDANIGVNGANGFVNWQSNGINPYWELQNPSGIFRAMMNLATLIIKANSGVGNGLEIDPVANDVKSTGTLSTAQPSANGAGKWNLGKLVVAASVPDATQYIETMVDGVLRKLVIAV